MEYATAKVKIHAAKTGDKTAAFHPPEARSGIEIQPEGGSGSLSVQFFRGPRMLAPGESAEVELILPNATALRHAELAAGARFAILDSGQVVGEGEILQRYQR